MHETLSPGALGYRITNTSHPTPGGQTYQIVKQVISTPSSPCLLVHTRLSVPHPLKEKLKLYALLAPHLDGSGCQNSGWAADTPFGKILVAQSQHRRRTWLAMACRRNIGGKGWSTPAAACFEKSVDSHSKTSLDSSRDLVADPQSVCNNSQSGIYGPDRRKKTRVGYIEIIDLVRFAVKIEHRLARIGSKTHCPGLVCRSANGDVLPEIERAVEQMRMDLELIAEIVQFLLEPLVRLLIGECKVQHNAAAVITYAVLRQGQILRGQPEIERVFRDPVERRLRKPLKNLRQTLAAD